MVKQDLLREAVAHYREKAYYDWKKVTLLSLLFIGSCLCLAHSTQLFSLFCMNKERSSLEHEIAHLQTSKMAHIKEAKQLKDAHVVARLLSQPVDIAHTLKRIALAIPEHTLLSELSYDKETFCRLTGYSGNTEELQLFLANLKAQGFNEIQLTSSQDDAAGRKFTITLLA